MEVFFRVFSPRNRREKRVSGTPVPGGLTAREALALVRGLGGLEIRRADLVEYCPPLDHADISAHLSAYLVWEMLAAIAVARR